eukprot:TRINITY_DN28250_c0_g1_i1.p1 TRINITY_DN28250_c0_g1~~TRINITY_DN28250_c0_g1_i1.p1  ORF type:complete len:207 (+),score=27.51 TRINITY_DN28250_c0_g1_i1:209-829(+)
MSVEATYVTPGQRLGPVSDYTPGKGTYARGEFIYASVVGAREVVQEGGADVMHVRKQGEDIVVPKIGDIVTGKVTKITPRFAGVEIICVGSTPLHESFQALVRLQDVRSHDIDRCEIPLSFRPGDIIRAIVISLGDSRSYFLTTAQKELGVIAAKSAEARAQMVALSWDTMMCPETRTKEFRKVAYTETLDESGVDMMSTDATGGS